MFNLHDKNVTKKVKNENIINRYVFERSGKKYLISKKCAYTYQYPTANV